MEDLTKSQLVLLLILVSIVVSFTTAITTASLFEQAPGTITNTVQRVVEKAVGAASDSGSKNTTTVITQEQQVVSVVKNVSPAVVSIVASKDLPVIERCASSNDFFDQLFPQLCTKGTQRQQVSAGSGFIVASDGLIVTNKHVVEDTAAEYTVIMNNGKKYDAKVVARDPLQDVALVRISATGLPKLSLGDSGGLEPGQSVIAIGNALGEFQNTISVGVISGLSRTVVASGEELRSVIQTDAAINPGNSGGPLINLDGLVIGVNTAVASGAENIGFALPINIIKKDIESVSKGEKITYPFLGVRYVMIDENVQKQYSLSVGEGAYITSSQGEAAVTPGSPAAQAGMQAGDIILEFGGDRITKSKTLADAISGRKIGETVPVKILRAKSELTLQVTLIERTF